MVKAMTDSSFQRFLFCSGIDIHNTPGNIKSSSIALRITVCTPAHTQMHSKKVLLAELSAQSPISCLQLFLERHVPGLNGMAQGILVSPLTQAHKHQGRTPTKPFPKSAASSYQNLQDRSEQEVYSIKHKTVLYQKIPPHCRQQKI